MSENYQAKKTLKEIAELYWKQTKPSGDLFRTHYKTLSTQLKPEELDWAAQELQELITSLKESSSRFHPPAESGMERATSEGRKPGLPPQPQSRETKGSGLLLPILLGVGLVTVILVVGLLSWQFWETYRAGLDTPLPGESGLPAHIALTLQSPEDKSEIQLEVSITDQNNRPVADGTVVSFRVKPEENASVEPAQAKTRAGKAQTIVRGKNKRGRVTIVATAGDQKEETSVNLSPAAVTSPTRRVTVNPDTPKAVLEVTVQPGVQEIGPDSELGFTFIVTNTGSVRGENISLTAELPEGTTFINSPQSFTQEENRIVWQLGTLDPGQPRQRQLTVKTSPKAPEKIVLDRYSVSDGQGVLVEGVTPGVVNVQAQVQPTAASLSPPILQVEISAEPNRLLADGKSPSTVKVRVTDEKGSPAPDSTAVQFELQPADSGQLDTQNASTMNGDTSVTFTASKKAGQAMVKAIAGGAADQISIVLLAHLNKVHSLLSKPEFNSDYYVITNLPQNTPIELLEGTQDFLDANGQLISFQKVAVIVWMKNALIEQDIDPPLISSGFTNESVLAGIDPTNNQDPLNIQDPNRKLGKAAGNLQATVIQERQDLGLIQVRIEGWMIQDRIS